MIRRAPRQAEEQRRPDAGERAERRVVAGEPFTVTPGGAEDREQADSGARQHVVAVMNQPDSPSRTTEAIATVAA